MFEVFCFFIMTYIPALGNILDLQNILFTSSTSGFHSVAVSNHGAVFA